MIILEKISQIIFITTAIFVSLWLSFFIEPFQSRYGSILAYFLLAMTVLFALAERKGIKDIFSKYDLFLLAYLEAIALGLLLRRYDKIERDGIFYIISIIAVYYFFKNGGKLLKNANKLACFICVFGDVVALFALIEIIIHKNIIYEYFVQNSWYKYYLYSHRAISTQIVSAALGTYLLACIPMAYFIFSNKENSRSFKIFGVGSAMLCITGLLTTFSRGSLLGLIVMTAVYFYKKNRKILIYFISGILIILLIFTVLKGTPGTKRYGLDNVGGLKRVYSAKTIRAVATYNILKDYPFIGIGVFNYRNVYNNYSPVKESYEMIKIPDNMHFMILGENGILGYLFFLLFVIFLLKNGYASNNEISMALSAAIIGILVNMFTYDLLYWTVPFYIFWIYSGLISAHSIPRSAQKNIPVSGIK